MNLRLQFAAITVAFAAVAAVLLWNTAPSTEAPVLAWKLGEDGAEPQQYAVVSAEAPLRLQVHSRSDVHVYVASFSATDGTLTLFPTPMLVSDAQNPLTAGEHLLPGKKGDQSLAWPVRGGVPGATEYVVVASKQALPELAAVLAKCRYFSNTTLPDGSLLFTYPKDVPAKDAAGKAALPHPLLLEAQKLAPVTPNGAMTAAKDHPDVWLACFKLAQVTSK
jgi:hypothetical protein